jgi:predicted chitinase
VSLLKFNNWISINEAVAAFDPAARYPDQTFGYPVGQIDSGKANLGGDNDNWGGSLSRALWFGKVADEWGAANGKFNDKRKTLVTSQKRSRVLTASGNTSDHYKGVTNSYAVDIAASGTEGDELLAYIMAKFGHPEYKGGSWININKDGYRYQVGWRVKNHFDHIHVGVKKLGGGKSSDTPSISAVTPVASAASEFTGSSIGATLLNNPTIKDWFSVNMPAIASTLTPEKLDAAINKNPDYLPWFKKKFNLSNSGTPANSDDAAIEAPLPDSITSPSTVDSTLSSTKIKSNYSGEKAKNIDLLVNEIRANGITNKYTIVGILSTIGKESGFIPQNEISYAGTDNRNIRKNFGARLKDLSDAELTKLKQDPAKFFDKIYGAEAKDELGWNTGNDNPGDGYKYRGRGFNQITFKYNYKKYSDLIGIDLVSNPDQLNNVAVAAKAAVAFILSGLKAKGLDPNSFKNKKEAIHACVQVNAGANKNIEGSSTLANAEKVSNNFNLA